MPDRPSMPPATLAYAIGDIHGCADLLESLLEIIAGDAGNFDALRRVLICVGDYVDRGPDSAGVVDRLIRGMGEDFETVCLKGNHEDMMLSCLEDPPRLLGWLDNGAQTTLVSYGVRPPAPDAAPEALVRCRDEFAAALHGEHREFYSGLRLSWALGDYFFAHAGVRPGTPLGRQSARDLMWIREGFVDSDADFGKVVVHGHTPAAEPVVRANRINIDTGAWMSGTLTALRLYGPTRAFLTAQA